MTALWFTLAGIALYFGADWILRRVERARGALLPHRELIYFGIVLVLAIVTFTLIRHLGR